jgi:hypothetical protein
MADVIRIKRRVSGAPGAPASLANAELAYNELDHTLYYGEGTGGAGGTASVIVAIGGPGLASSTNPAMDGTAAPGTASLLSRGDHVHPSDTSRAPLASPAFTGTPTAPTVTPGSDSTTKLATTAFVQSAISAVSAGVTNITVSNGLSGGGTGVVNIGISPNGIANASLGTMAAHTYKGNNTGAAATPIDVTAAQLMTDLGGAPLNSPAFTGTPTAPTAANGTNTIQLATTQYVLATRIDQLQPPNIDVAWNSHRITGLLDPASPGDAATKNYVDATIQGMQVKPTARLATAAALPANTYANGTAGLGATLTATANAALSVDGTAVAANDVILVKNEAAAANNGLYIVTNAGSASAAYVLTRHVDMDTSGEYSGAFVPVGNAGATNANTLWLANPTTPVTVGTTAIPFTQLNSATSYTPGNGISIAGNVISAVGVAGHITVGGTGIDIASTYTGQVSITTLGTIATGTWQASTIAVPYGGTGATTLTGYVKGNGTAAMTGSATIPNTDITGLGTMAVQNANAVAISGGTIDGITLDGGTF